MTSKKESKPSSRTARFMIGILVALLALVAAYVIVCLVIGPMKYRAFYSAARLEETYPGRSQGFVPQGVTGKDGEDWKLVCGYMMKEKPSRLYVLSADGTQTMIELMTEDGKPYTGHAGGLTAAGDYVYISNAHKLFLLPLSDILNAKDGDTLTFAGHVDVPVNASFCSSDGEYVYVGEYHADGYETDESHKIKTADGDWQALVLGYRLDQEAPFGLASIPAVAYAVRDEVQGFSVLPDGEVVLSCSGGFSPSHLWVYTANGDPDKKLTLEDNDLPLYILDSRRLSSDMRLPHMSEDLEYRNGRLFIGFEAGALKFGAGLLPATVRQIASLEIPIAGKE